MATARVFAFRGFTRRIAPVACSVGYMLNGQLHDYLLSGSGDDQALPGAPEARKHGTEFFETSRIVLSVCVVSDLE